MSYTGLLLCLLSYSLLLAVAVTAYTARVAWLRHDDGFWLVGSRTYAIGMVMLVILLGAAIYRAPDVSIVLQGEVGASAILRIAALALSLPLLSIIAYVSIPVLVIHYLPSTVQGWSRSAALAVSIVAPSIGLIVLLTTLADAVMLVDGVR